MIKRRRVLTESDMSSLDVRACKLENLEVKIKSQRVTGHCGWCTMCASTPQQSVRGVSEIHQNNKSNQRSVP